MKLLIEAETQNTDKFNDLARHFWWHHCPESVAKNYNLTPRSRPSRNSGTQATFVCLQHPKRGKVHLVINKKNLKKFLTW